MKVKFQWRDKMKTWQYRVSWLLVPTYHRIYWHLVVTILGHCWVYISSVIMQSVILAYSSNSPYSMWGHTLTTRCLQRANTSRLKSTWNSWPIAHAHWFCVYYQCTLILSVLSVYIDLVFIISVLWFCLYYQCIVIVIIGTLLTSLYGDCDCGVVTPS